MSQTTLIYESITNNRWEELEQTLKNKSGLIGSLVGRYICERNSADYSDINRICWWMLQATTTTPFKETLDDKIIPISNVIRQLRRLYNETETALEEASYCAKKMTSFYDNCYENGFYALKMLEDNILGPRTV